MRKADNGSDARRQDACERIIGYSRSQAEVVGRCVRIHNHLGMLQKEHKAVNENRRKPRHNGIHGV